MKQTIIEAKRELTATEKVKIKHLQTIKFDEVVTPDKSIVIRPGMWAVVETVSDRTGNEYKIYLIEDLKDGSWYSTGSESFWENFKDIELDMDGEEYDLQVYKMASKNYSGRYFLTCNIK